MTRPWARSPALRDLTLVGLVAGGQLIALAAGSGFLGHALGPADVIGAILAVPLVLAGRRAPVLTLGLATLGTGVTVAITGQQALLFAAVVILLYRVAVQTRRRTAVLSGLATIAALSVAVVPFLAGKNLDRDGDIAIWCVLAIAVGDAVRSRRAYLDEVEERVRRAEHSRETEARRRVAEERLRIARDLHDLVAHRMAVINVQAGAASHLLAFEPQEAERSLRIVRESVAQVLEELGEMLGVLRNPDDPLAPVDPTPTLRELGALVESFAQAGLQVTWRSSGTLEDLPEFLQLVVYRLAQEGLTNAQRHGDGRVRLDVERTDSAVDVTITNHIARSGDLRPGSGFGVAGMRERVSAVGGTIEVGPTGGDGFRVAARLPVAARTAA